MKKANFLSNYLKNSSVHGFKYLALHNPARKRLWFVVELLLVMATLYVAIDAYFEFLNRPTIIILESTAFPVEKLPFPAIAICNMNTISKKRAWTLAQNLSTHFGGNVSEIVEQIKFFADLISYEAIDEQALKEFENLINNYNLKLFHEFNSTLLVDQFAKLITPCEELLVRCYWKGKQYNCSNLFRLEKTYDGYCCVFRNSAQLETVFMHNAGSRFDSGLTVEIFNNIEDYFYTLKSTIGVNVLLFHSDSYPDRNSGELSEVVVGNGIEAFIEVNAPSVQAAEEVIKYPFSKRRCYFDKDGVTTLFGKYTYSDCLTECRIKSVMALCKCIPFTIPWKINISVCTFSHLACLKKYKKMWSTRYPNVFVGDEEQLEEELISSLECNHCLHLCDAVIYRVGTNFADLRENISLSNSHSVIHIYFGKDQMWLYKQDVQYYWFEILSNFGNFFAVFLGLGLLCVVEFCYYFVIWVWNKY